MKTAVERSYFDLGFDLGQTIKSAAPPITYPLPPTPYHLPPKPPSTAGTIRPPTFPQTRVLLLHLLDT
jgi:hypothetical protein